MYHKVVYAWYRNATSNKFHHKTVEARSKTDTKHAEAQRRATTTTIRKYSNNYADETVEACKQRPITH